MTNEIQHHQHDAQAAVLEAKLQAAVGQCWTVQVLLLMALHLLALFQGAIKDDFSEFLHHPGEAGWNSAIVLISFYALMSVLVRVCNTGWFRWLNVPLLLITLLPPIGHQVRHILDGHMPNQMVTVEVLSVLVAMFGALVALRWARLLRQERGVPEGAANAA